ncbi:MAG: TRAP transporter large permease [Rhizobiaceae bacterium]|nr:TRAP transporter large permease [Rhizobiaceae bacterium]|tara:strand:- start:19686 stop:20978 length:1293 start_codon:yes stop_codon:yes gene_type:complete
MGNELITVLVIGGLLGFMVLGVPIGVSMALSGFFGIVAIVGLNGTMAVLSDVITETAFSYHLSIIPLFILMGNLASRSGLSRELYQGCAVLFGGVRGGLGMATIGACGCFAAVSGSSLATATSMGQVAIPEMKRFNYSDRLATGVVAAGGTIGVLIPPSIILVLYGILTETSITDLFIAALIPGLLQVMIYMITISVLVRLRPEDGPAGEKTTLRQKFLAIPSVAGMLVLFTVVIGGIYLGVFTPTEAAGIGAIIALLLGVFRRQLGFKAIVDALFSTLKTSGMVFLILAGATILVNFFVFSRANLMIADWVIGLDYPPLMILLIILGIYLVLGCFLDSIGMVLLTIPVVFPIIMQLGYDPVWFGIMVVVVVETGMITPPMGINVFAIKGIAPKVPIASIFAGVAPFWAADMFRIGLLIAFPALALYLVG